MGAQHTPGPWIANTTFPIDNATVFADAEYDDIHSAPIAYCTDHEEQRRPVAECQANALLIAAAPEMLAELESLDALWTKAFNFSPEDAKAPDATVKRWRAVRAVIAKARGRL